MSACVALIQADGQTRHQTVRQAIDAAANSQSQEAAVMAALFEGMVRAVRQLTEDQSLTDEEVREELADLAEELLPTHTILN